MWHFYARKNGRMRSRSHFRNMPVTDEREPLFRSLPVPKAMVGALIGKDGSTIKWLQRNSGCERIWVDTNEDDREALGQSWCHVRMLGSPNDHYNATRMVMSVLMRHVSAV